MQAGLKEVRMHDLRHSFASAMMNMGMTLDDVKEMLGHANIKTTERYAHLSRERLRTAAASVETFYGEQPWSSLPLKASAFDCAVTHRLRSPQLLRWAVACSCSSMKVVLRAPASMQVGASTEMDCQWLTGQPVAGCSRWA